MMVAGQDAEKMAMVQMKQREHFAERMRELFKEADESGDGQIDADEFVNMLQKPVVGAIFRDLGLEVDEVVALFHLVADDDGLADYKEFLEGTLKMKSSARTIDVIQILHESGKLARQNEEI